MQTAPQHMITHLDKCLREASTLDGVLEFRHEHFWTLGFGNLVGSLHVRIRRDANEQLVLQHLHTRLSNLLSDLTIQVFKDEWSWNPSIRYMNKDHSKLVKYSPSTTGTLQSASSRELSRNSSKSSLNESHHGLNSVLITSEDKNSISNHPDANWVQNV